MAVYATSCNPAILIWARKCSGHNIQEIAAKLNKPVEIIEKWETGEAQPTYGQLEKLAYDIYKRPLALFFFPDVPEELDIKESFRTIPDFEIEDLSADTLFALRYARSLQLSLDELGADENQREKNIINDIALSVDDEIKESANKIREYLDIDISQQISWRTMEDALKEWRDSVQDVGIYVFKRSFKQKGISGFCLDGSKYPIIFLNNGNSKSRQIFSIAHELAHLLLHNNHISKTKDYYLTSAIDVDHSIEQFCNRVAAELIVPTDSIQQYLTNNFDEKDINDISQKFKVSREVILRKFYDHGYISRDDYRFFTDKWISEFENMTRGRGGNYYATQATYLGSKYLRLVFNRYYDGKITLEEAADYLSVKSSSFFGLEEYALKS